MDPTESFQQRHFPDGECFGCGPKNARGLQTESFPTDDGGMACDWNPRPEHSNCVGAVCGEILSSALDCRAVTAAARALMEREGAPTFAVTKEFTMRFLKPTPLQPARPVARVAELRERSATVIATAEVDGEMCARYRERFVVPRD